MSSGQARSRRELRAQKRGDQVVGRTSRLEEADGAGEDMRHALPFVHLDALPRSQPQGVVEKHLRCADMNLNAGRSGCGTIDGGRTWVPAVVVTEVLARAGLESGARELRIFGGFAFDAAASEGEIRPRREQNPAASVRLTL